jgi:hypothetical protein
MVDVRPQSVPRVDGSVPLEPSAVMATNEISFFWGGRGTYWLIQRSLSFVLSDATHEHVQFPHRATRPAVRGIVLDFFSVVT